MGSNVCDSSEQNKLCRGVQEGAEAFDVFDDNLAGIHIQQTFGLKSHQVSRNQFAHGAQLVGELLMGRGKLKFDAAFRPGALALGQLDQCRNEPLADGGEGKFLDNPHQPSQARSHNDEDFQCYFGMLHAVGLEVAPGDEGDLGVFDGDCRSGKRTTVEDWQFRDRFAWDVYGQHLLTAIH